MKLSAGLLFGAAGSVFGLGIVSLDVQGSPQRTLNLPTEFVRRIAQRDALNLGALNNITGGGYYANISVGTPAQTVTLRLDTGSSDTWVISPSAALCTSVRDQDEYGGGCSTPYDPTKSSTYTLVQAGGFSISYLDGSQIEGNYFTDEVTIDGKTVKQQLGIAENTELGNGIIGLGLESNEATDTEYPTLVDSLYSSGAIGRKAFSLYLNDLDQSSGSVLFGGIDTEKFIGQLQTLSILPDAVSGTTTSYTVSLTGLGLTTASGVTNYTEAGFNMPAVLDSGSTLSLLPHDVVTQLWDTFNVVSASQVGLIDCATANNANASTTYLSLNVSGKVIQVPLGELIINSLADVGELLEGELPFNNPCVFGVQDAALYEDPSSGSFVVFGDSILRSMYVVYDEQNLQIGIAQSNLNSTKTNLVTLSASGALPAVTGVASQAPYSPSATTGGSGASGTSSGSGSSSTTKNAAGRLSGPAGGGSLGILALTAFFTLLGAVIFAL